MVFNGTHLVGIIFIFIEEKNPNSCGNQDISDEEAVAVADNCWAPQMEVGNHLSLLAASEAIPGH